MGYEPIQIRTSARNTAPHWVVIPLLHARLHSGPPVGSQCRERSYSTYFCFAEDIVCPLIAGVAQEDFGAASPRMTRGLQGQRRECEISTKCSGRSREIVPR